MTHPFAAAQQNLNTVIEGLEYLDQGFSIFDRDLHLVACNRRLQELLDLPPELSVPGTPLEVIFRYNAERGEYGPGGVERLVQERLLLARRLEPHCFERTRSDGTVLEIRGNPLPDGGFIATYADITERKRAENEKLANLRYFQCMDQVNRAIAGTNDLEQVMSAVLDVVRSVFDADRAGLIYPCDPDAPSWKTFMERTHPDYPGVLELGLDMPMEAEAARTFRISLDAEGPIQIDKKHPDWPVVLGERFQVNNIMAMALHPLVGKPWLFMIHQCSCYRQWTAEEGRLFREVGLRLSDALTSLLILRNLRDNERRLEEAERIAHVGYWDRDLLAGQVDLSDETRRIFGLAPEDGGPDLAQWHRTWQQRIHPDDRERAARAVADALRGDRPYNLEYRIVHPDGEVLDVQSKGEVTRDAAGRPVRIFGFVQDITKRKRVEEALRKSEEKYRHIVDFANEGIWMLGPDEVTSFVNARMAEMLGYQREQIVGRPVRDFMFEEDLPGFDRLMANRRPGRVSNVEVRYRCRGGQALWTLASLAHLYDDDRRFVGSFGMFTDITDRKRQEEQLLYQAHYDALTGLPNRFLSLDRLGQQIKCARRRGSRTALLFLDLDDFKKVNDALGHEVGDQVLISAAGRLRAAVRAVDTVGRLGGDEFVVLVDNIESPTDVCPVAEKIVQAFQEVFPVMGRHVMLTASLGIAVFPADGEEPLVLLRNADTAMYHSKRMGRNVYHFFTESMNENVARRLQLEEQLRLALDRDELFLLYQPIVAVASGTVVGAEVLLRWNNSVLGVVGPEEFIGVAEQSGLIIAIGDWVIATALRQLVEWCRLGFEGFRLALNVSPRQFRQAGLVEMLQRRMEEAGLAGCNLDLEITEGVLLSGECGAAQVLEQLRRLGVGISMDDFGTGYSSLSYLRNFPFDALKIDRSFIGDVIDDPNDRELVTAAIRMAKGLGLRVVAEGVESADQLAFLRQEACDFAQGYYFSEPVSAARMTEAIRQGALPPGGVG